MTTLRAAMVIGPGSAAFETIVALVDRLPGMICPRWVSTSTQPIALHDITAYLVAAAGREDMLGESYDAGGPDVMTYREMIERIARIRGRHPLIVEVPILSPRLSSWWLTLVTPVQSHVARPLVEGLRTPTVAHDQRCSTWCRSCSRRSTKQHGRRFATGRCDPAPAPEHGARGGRGAGNPPRLRPATSRPLRSSVDRGRPRVQGGRYRASRRSPSRTSTLRRRSRA